MARNRLRSTIAREPASDGRISARLLGTAADTGMHDLEPLRGVEVQQLRSSRSGDGRAAE